MLINSFLGQPLVQDPRDDFWLAPQAATSPVPLQPYELHWVAHHTRESLPPALQISGWLQTKSPDDPQPWAKSTLAHLFCVLAPSSGTLQLFRNQDDAQSVINAKAPAQSDGSADGGDSATKATRLSLARVRKVKSGREENRTVEVVRE